MKTEQRPSCKWCLYLKRYTVGLYCSMKNRWVVDEDSPICDKWKKSPKKKEKPAETYEWVQIQFQPDAMRETKKKEK